jgi:phosphoglycerate dehydrogenase-like enzyme
MLLAFARRLPFAFRAQSRRQWRAPEGDNTFELAGQTVLIVGVGAIGERTAELCRALGMRVLGVRRSPENGVSGVEHMFAPADLLEALPEADFVVLTVPLTEETRGLIGPEELRTMQPSAYLINIGRGGTVQTDALVQALQAGQIAGAGLDVTDPEPLPEDSPLWDMPNVIITAHYSGSTPKYDERAMQIFKDNLRRYLAGEELQNQVDIELGY